MEKRASACDNKIADFEQELERSKGPRIQFRRPTPNIRSTSAIDKRRHEEEESVKQPSSKRFKTEERN